MLFTMWFECRSTLCPCLKMGGSEGGQREGGQREGGRRGGGVGTDGTHVLTLPTFNS